MEHHIGGVVENELFALLQGGLGLVPDLLALGSGLGLLRIGHLLVIAGAGLVVFPALLVLIIIVSLDDILFDALLLDHISLELQLIAVLIIELLLVLSLNGDSLLGLDYLPLCDSGVDHGGLLLLVSLPLGCSLC